MSLPSLTIYCRLPRVQLFFFNDTATTEICTLSLHDALPICDSARRRRRDAGVANSLSRTCVVRDRKSTRLNSSHITISYAVFCLKKKNGMGVIARGRGAPDVCPPPTSSTVHP